jgi:hypothetical protein
MPDTEASREMLYSFSKFLHDLQHDVLAIRYLAGVSDRIAGEERRRNMHEIREIADHVMDQSAHMSQAIRELRLNIERGNPGEENLG